MKYKTNRWYGTLSLAMVLLTLAFSSCTKESLDVSMTGGDGVEVRVAFPRSVVTRTTTGNTEIGTDNENRLDHITILVFNGDGSKLETVLSEDVRDENTSLPTTQPKWKSQQTLQVSPVINPLSPKKIYALANWSRTAFDKATYTEAMLKEELTTIIAVADLNDAKAYPMLMSGSKSVPNLTSLSYNVMVDMERQSSKIRTQLTVPINVQNYMSSIEWQTDLAKITVANIPNKSYVIGRKASPSSIILLNTTAITVNDTKPAVTEQTVPAIKDLKWSESVYITENPVVGASQDVKDVSTYIVVQLPYKNRITGTIVYDNYYKLFVNDTRNGNSPHEVLRNTIYNLNITILGMGLPINNLVPDVNVDDVLTVSSWEKGEIVDVEAAENYFNVSRTLIDFQSFETSLHATIVTNVADWKLVKADGTTMFSYAEKKTSAITIDGITYILTGSASVADIAVGRVATSIDFPTQKMTFIAKNLKIPFTVIYDNGFIPNSVLIAAWWPAGTLPANGLQIAKRGDKVLPSGVAQSDDQLRQWKTSTTLTPGTSAGLGMGLSSTAAMKGAEHPAAQYCLDMGLGWHLPSKDELQLISENKSSFGSSYSLGSLYYWSATEVTFNESWFVFIGNGSSIYDKTSTLRVRCVRGI